MSGHKLSEVELQQALANLPGWVIREGKLHREYQFASFTVAMAWMVAAGIEAEKMNHHPEWFNVYNRVRVDLVTHDLGQAISSLDVQLAQKMEQLAQVWSPA
ncbi:4a-hydroxytetrahydrobiopterin dehydratase [Trichothermofontia sp.]